MDNNSLTQVINEGMAVSFQIAEWCKESWKSKLAFSMYQKEIVKRRLRFCCRLESTCLALQRTTGAFDRTHCLFPVGATVLISSPSQEEEQDAKLRLLTFTCELFGK